MRDFNSIAYKTWRQKVFIKDNFTCRKCQAKKKLESHHVNDWSGNAEDRFNQENGVTLCISCHQKFHQRHGKGNNNIYQLEEFLGKELDKERSTRLF